MLLLKMPTEQTSDTDWVYYLLYSVKIADKIIYKWAKKRYKIKITAYLHIKTVQFRRDNSNKIYNKNSAAFCYC